MQPAKYEGSIAHLQNCMDTALNALQWLVVTKTRSHCCPANGLVPCMLQAFRSQLVDDLYAHLSVLDMEQCEAVACLAPLGTAAWTK